MIRPQTNNEQPASGSNKILWLSIIQGYAILLVIIGHVNAFTYRDPAELYPLSEFIQRFCYSFHMPLFMFVSGGLLYLSRINRGWSTKDLYVDKLKRLLLPYIFFTIIAFVIKIIFASYAKRTPDASFSGFVNAFWSPSDGPLGEMWFIGTLMWLMAFYPLYKQLLKNPWTELILLTISLIPLILGINPGIKGWFNLNGIFQYAFYFIAGLLFFKYRLYSIFEKSLLSVIAVCVAYISFFMLGYSQFRVIIAVLGILATFGVGIRIIDVFPNIFRSFRDSSYQIFLVGLFPQMLIELLIWKKFHPGYMIIPFYIISVSLAIICGVLTKKIATRIPFRFGRWFFGLK